MDKKCLSAVFQFWNVMTALFKFPFTSMMIIALLTNGDINIFSSIPCYCIFPFHLFMDFDIRIDF